jgi:hypothetical protein
MILRVHEPVHLEIGDSFNKGCSFVEVRVREAIGILAYELFTCLGDPFLFCGRIFLAALVLGDIAALDVLPTVEDVSRGGDQASRGQKKMNLS